MTLRIAIQSGIVLKLQMLRKVYNNKKDIYEELLSMAKLPSLVNRRLQDIPILMYKVKNSIPI